MSNRIFHGLFLLILVSMFVSGICVQAVAADIGRPDPEGTPTGVEIAIYLADLDEVSTSGQNFIANVFVLYRWKDPRLAHGGPGTESFHLTEVWHPRLQIINQQKVFETMPNIVRVSGDGEVTYRQRAWGSFSQPLKLHDFPFDRQTFTIQLVTPEYGPEDVSLKSVKPLPGVNSGMAEQLSVADWRVLSWEVKSQPYEPVPGLQISGFSFIFEGKRYYGYFITKVILPLLYIVAMSWMVFWINPEESGTQISVAITAMLTLIAYRFAVGADLPKIPYMTRLDYFIFGSTTLVFATLLEVMVTTKYARTGRPDLAKQIDYWSRRLFPAAFIALALKSLAF